MILPRSRVQLSIVNVYHLFGLDSCGNEFILVLLDLGDTDLFRNDLDGAHLLTIRDGVNNIRIQPLKDLFLHHFLKSGVHSSLSVPVRFGSVLKVYLMLHYDRTNATNVS